MKHILLPCVNVWFFLCNLGYDIVHIFFFGVYVWFFSCNLDYDMVHIHSTIFADHNTTLPINLVAWFHLWFDDAKHMRLLFISIWFCTYDLNHDMLDLHVTIFVVQNSTLGFYIRCWTNKHGKICSRSSYFRHRGKPMMHDLCLEVLYFMLSMRPQNYWEWYDDPYPYGTSLNHISSLDLYWEIKTVNLVQ